jgi:alpha-amylase
MVDVVVNHNVWNGDGSSVDYSQFNPFNSEDNYHPYCLIEDYEDQTQVEECWLGDDALPLPDLKTDDQGVAAEYDSWISGLVSNYSGKPF